MNGLEPMNLKKGLKNEMNEYLKSRCCMCPNVGKNRNVCPGIVGTPHPKDSPCRFVKEYIDARGWKYRVMSGIGDAGFMGRYQKPGKTGCKCMRNMEWRKSFDHVQSELNAMAKEKGWEETG